MNIFEYTDYKSCINDWIEEQPKRGYGQLRKLALHLNVNSVVVSQVFRGERDLTLEQALDVARFVGFTEGERDYFLLLVQKARAGSYELKNVLEKQLAALSAASQALKNRVKHQRVTDEDRATFYSQWYFSAVRLGVSIPHLKTVSALADHLNLDRVVVAQVIEFLMKHKLIVGDEGDFEMGPRVTHVGHDSPFVSRHHMNWRIKGMQSIENRHEHDLFYSGPMALSEAAAVEIRNKLLKLVEEATRAAADSDSQVLRCLNIDWFAVGKRSPSGER